MARQNPPLLAFNRGLVSPKALARVDLDRTQLSAAVMTNWLPKTQGAMTIRPGTKFMDSVLNDTGAELIEFVAATEDVALLELTASKLRVWINNTRMGRPAVNTTLALSDTGWANTSTGGNVSTDATNIIPEFNDGDSGEDGIQITASSSRSTHRPWAAVDRDGTTYWQDTGDGNSTVPSWLNIDFGGDTGASQGDTGNRRSVRTYSIKAVDFASGLDNMPRRWSLITGNFDTGTFATDTGKWTLEDTQGSESGWNLSERKYYTLPGADTGTVEARRHWRLNFLQTDGGNHLVVADIEMFDAAGASQVKLEGGSRIFNATSRGALARLQKTVVVSDTGTEHSLDITVSRGPVTLRVGSSSGNDDYITDTLLGTGHHNLAFTPEGNFYITLQSEDVVDRIVESLSIGDSGTVELNTPWAHSNLANVRYDQSADVVFVDCVDVHPMKIERRGTGRSWSVVKYQPTDGPLVPTASSAAKLRCSQLNEGNTRIRSDIPFFREGHEGALFALFHNGQDGTWYLGATEASTDPIEMTGISDTGDTGTPSQESERRMFIDVSGTYSGTLVIERSFDGPDIGFHPVSQSGGYVIPTGGSGTATDTGTFARSINDRDDNVTVWYRVRMSNWNSGAAKVDMYYSGGGTTGIARVTEYVSPTEVNVESGGFSDTGPTDAWQEGDFSGRKGYPTAVALHEGRLGHAKEGTIFLSEADNYEGFNQDAEGASAPIIRTLGSGPVDNIRYMISLLRLIIGTSGAEMAMRSSSLDEPLTPDNSSAKPFSTQGSANLRAVKMDNYALTVQRSLRRLMLIGFGTANSADAFGDYGTEELTLLVPDLLAAGVVSIAVQRHPDTRIHCVLADGTVAILTYEPKQEVLCWSMWEGDTGTGAAVENVAVLPGEGEDSVYYVIRRTINGATKRYLERWAMEDETVGDTGLTILADSAVLVVDDDSGVQKSGIRHLRNTSVVAVAQDTGQANAMRDLSPDVAGVQETYIVGDSGRIILDTGNFTNVIVGKPYRATYKSTKLAFAAEAGTALAQLKRTDKIGFVLYRTHNNGLFFGNDTGTLDPLPRKTDRGAAADADKIFDTLDQVAMPFPGLWSTDSRVVLRGKSPRPVTVLAAVPTVTTNEKV